MATRSRRRPTVEERDARRRQQLEQLEHATTALLTSEGWQQWLRTRSRFHRYSLRNTLLIAFQSPHATHVAGFRSWLELGRCVRKGEKGIRILASVRYKSRTANEDDDERERQLVGFRLVAVFDVSQTEPLPGVEPAPLEPPSEPISGNSHAHLLAPLAQHAITLGFNVEYGPLDGPAGYCSSRLARIVIDSALPANGKVATLVHELAHAHGIDYKNYSRPEAELIVESVACIVCGSVGLDTTSECVPYLAGWNDEQAAERIKLLAGTIDEIARAIERAIDAHEGSKETSAGTFTAADSEAFASSSAPDGRRPIPLLSSERMFPEKS
jgi:antirestriction protein ArdC